MPNVLDLLQVETGLVPKDITGASQTGQIISLQNYAECLVVIQQGAWAAGTPAVTLSKFTDVDGTGTATLAFEAYWQKAGLTAGTFTESAVTSNTFNLPNTANTLTVIKVTAAMLGDTYNAFRVNVASPGSNADLLGISYILVKPRYPEEPQKDAKVDA